MHKFWSDPRLGHGYQDIKCCRKYFPSQPGGSPLMFGLPFAGHDRARLSSPSPVVACQLDPVASPVPSLHDPVVWLQSLFCVPRKPAVASRQSRSLLNMPMASVCAPFFYRRRCANDVQVLVLAGARARAHSASQYDPDEAPRSLPGRPRLVSYLSFHHFRPSHTQTWEFRPQVLVL